MKTKKILLFSLILTLIFACSLAYFSVFALGTYVPLEPTPVPTDGYFEPALSMWWNEKKCGFARPDFIIYKYGLREPFDWSTRPDVSPFGFQVIDDNFGDQLGVALSMTYTGTFQGGTSYMYTFLFDIYLEKPLGSEFNVYPSRTFSFDITPFTEYGANAVLVDQDSFVYTFDGEEVIKEYSLDRIHFEVKRAVKNHYRVQINLVARNNVDFYMIGIMCENFYQRSYDSVYDGVYLTPSVEDFENFKDGENAIIEDANPGIQSALDNFNYILSMPSLLRSALLAATTIFDGLILHLNTLKSVIYFSLAIGILTSVLAISHSLASSFGSKGGKD